MYYGPPGTYKWTNRVDHAIIDWHIRSKNFKKKKKKKERKKKKKKRNEKKKKKIQNLLDNYTICLLIFKVKTTTNKQNYNTYLSIIL